MGLMLLYCFSSQRSSVAQGDYMSLLLCVYNPLLSANHFVSLVSLTVWKWKSKTDRGFLDLVFGKVCFVDCVLKKKKKRHHTCLKRLKILSVQPMDCCNWETQTDKLMCEL